MSIVNSSIRDSLIAEKLVSYYAEGLDSESPSSYYSGVIYKNNDIYIESECDDYPLEYGGYDPRISIKVTVSEIDDYFYIGELKLTDQSFKFEFWDDNPKHILDLLYYYFSNDSN